MILKPVLSCALALILALSAWMTQDRAPTSLTLLALAAAAGVGWLYWTATLVAYEIGTYRRDAADTAQKLANAQATTPRNRALEIIHRMDAEQLRFYDRHPEIQIIHDVRQPPLVPMSYIRLGGREYLRADVDGILRRCDPPYLAPVREWGEGSRERDLAIDFYGALEGYGYIAPANGNKPARVLGDWGVFLQALGYETAEGSDTK